MGNLTVHEGGNLIKESPHNDINPTSDDKDSVENISNITNSEETNEDSQNNATPTEEINGTANERTFDDIQTLV